MSDILLNHLRDRAYTHVVILADLPGELLPNGSRENTRYFYECYPIDQIMLYIIPAARFGMFQFIPINPHNWEIIEQFRRMYPQWDHSQNPYPPEFWQTGEWVGQVGAYLAKEGKSDG